MHKDWLITLSIAYKKSIIYFAYSIDIGRILLCVLWRLYGDLKKIYLKILEWKEKSKGKKALLIEGARRIGKSTVAEEIL